MAFSRRALSHAGRVVAGSGAVEPGPGGRRRRRHGPVPITDQGHHPLPNFGNNGNHYGQLMHQGGYTGLAGVLAALQEGMNQSQFQHLEQGRGSQGYQGIGGQHGAFKGLSPYANHFIASLMEKKAAEHQDVTGLEGDALWKATLMNNLADQNAAADPTYQLHSGVDVDFLQQLLGQGIGGHKAYQPGYGPQGGPTNRIHPFMPGRRVGQQRPEWQERHTQRMGQGYSNQSSGLAQRRTRPFRPGGVVRRPLR